MLSQSEDSKKLIIVPQTHMIMILRHMANYCNASGIDKIRQLKTIKDSLIPFTNKTQIELLNQFYKEKAKVINNVLRDLNENLSNGLYYENQDRKHDKNYLECLHFCITYEQVLQHFVFKLLDLFALKNNEIKNTWFIQDEMKFKRILEQEKALQFKKEIERERNESSI